MRKVYITKYALTTGIIEAEMEVNEGNTSCYGKPPGWDFKSMFFVNEFFFTEEEARVNCNLRVKKKIESIQKQLAKIQKIKF